MSRIAVGPVVLKFSEALTGFAMPKATEFGAVFVIEITSVELELELVFELEACSTRDQNQSFSINRVTVSTLSPVAHSVAIVTNENWPVMVFDVACARIETPNMKMQALASLRVSPRRDMLAIAILACDTKRAV